jgi:hypothetical protein
MTCNRNRAWQFHYRVATNLLDLSRLNQCHEPAPPEKSVHIETVAVRESRPVACPNPLHLAVLSARLFPNSSILQAKVLAPVISSRASSVPAAIICRVSVGLDLEIMERLAHYPLSSCYVDSAAHVQFSELQRDDRATTVRPIVGKF